MVQRLSTVWGSGREANRVGAQIGVEKKKNRVESGCRRDPADAGGTEKGLDKLVVGVVRV